MHVFLVQILGALLSYGKGDLLLSLPCEEYFEETVFDTNVHVEASLAYSKLSETSLLIRHANEAISKEAQRQKNAFVEEMRIPQIELCEEEGDERTFHYSLYPVFSTPTLISFYGNSHQHLGGAHGSVHYITRTFWQNGGTICELSLDDLFLPGTRERLFHLCKSYFETRRCGYYSHDDHSWVGFGSGDLDSFVLTEKGLLLIFQNYVVSGYEDEPITLLFPYNNLSTIVNPNGPLVQLTQQKTLDKSKDQWLTTKSLKVAPNIRGHIPAVQYILNSFK